MTHKGFNQTRNYMYVDSSEDSLDQEERVRHLQNLNEADLTYRDSSQSQNDNQQNNQRSDGEINYRKNGRFKSHKLCKVNPDQFLLRDKYLGQLQMIIKENQLKLTKKTPLLLADTDKQIIGNISKRNKNYGYFLRTLQIDKKYNRILSSKVQKVKNLNQRKKQVLQNQKNIQIIKKDEQEMKRYVLDKKLKEQIVIDKIQKYAYKIGIQKIRHKQKVVKFQAKQIQKVSNMKIIKLQIKQKNHIQELRQQLEEIKQINRVNKLEQKKVLVQMQKDNSKDKRLLLAKTQGTNLKSFII